MKQYQMRLSFLLWMVALVALVFGARPSLDWVVRDFPYPRRYVEVKENGVTYQIDSRAWRSHPLNPRNRR
jgi:hypothetical protein